MNGQYQLEILLHHSSPDITITNLGRASLTRSGEAAAALVVGSDIIYDVLLDADPDILKDIFFTPTPVPAASAKLENYRQIILKKSPLAAGSYTLEMTFTLADGRELTTTQDFELSIDVVYSTKDL